MNKKLQHFGKLICSLQKQNQNKKWVDLSKPFALFAAIAICAVTLMVVLRIGKERTKEKELTKINWQQIVSDYYYSTTFKVVVIQVNKTQIKPIKRSK